MNVFGIDFRLSAAGSRLHATDRHNENAGGGAAPFRPSPPRSRRSLRSRSRRPETTARGRAATKTTKATKPWERILAAGRVDVMTVRWVNDFATSGSQPFAVEGQICEPRANPEARRGIAGRRRGKSSVSPSFFQLSETFFPPTFLPKPPRGWGESLQPHACGLARSAPATRMLLGQNNPGHGITSTDWGDRRANGRGHTQQRGATPTLPP